MDKNVVLYDAQCPLCVFQMRLLTWLDWCNILSLVPASDSTVARIAPQITADELQSAIHCISRDSKIYRGARCIRFIGLRMPLLVPLALFLWIPGVIFIAEIFYQMISRNRLVLSRLFGCKEACAILPKHQRDQDKIL